MEFHGFPFVESRRPSLIMTGYISGTASTGSLQKIRWGVKFVYLIRSMAATGLACLLSLAALAQERSSGPADSYRVVHVYPHDPDAFTQGLVYEAGYLFESTGRNGKSSIRKVDIATGQVIQRYNLPPEYFGEGLTTWGPNLVQLTWTTGLGFVYDRSSFAVKRKFRYSGEGWGLTKDRRHLILSDGTPILRFLDPETFEEVSRLAVTDVGGVALKNLNELEFIHDEIYANIWYSDRIARISPATGKVLGWIDLTGLIDKRKLTDSDAVLNGIAYDAKQDRLFVTGKLWPSLFEIKLRRAANNSRPH